MRLCIVCHDGPLTLSQDFCCSEACATKYAQDNAKLAQVAEAVVREATPKCRICSASLIKRQRLYCSRRCNHRAETARRKLREAQAAATKLEAATAPTHTDLMVAPETLHDLPDTTLPSSGRRLVAVEQHGCATIFVYAPPPATSLWQRIRKCVTNAWHKFIFLVGEDAGN